MPFAVELSGLLGVLIVLMGAWGVLFPARLASFVQGFASRGGLVVAIGVRVVVGLSLWFAAPSSRAPLLLQVFGVAALLAAVALPLLGRARFAALIDGWTRLAPSAQRAWSLVAVAFGAVILWSLLPGAT